VAAHGRGDSYGQGVVAPVSSDNVWLPSYTAKSFLPNETWMTRWDGSSLTTADGPVQVLRRLGVPGQVEQHAAGVAERVAGEPRIAGVLAEPGREDRGMAESPDPLAATPELDRLLRRAWADDASGHASAAPKAGGRTGQARVEAGRGRSEPATAKAIASSAATSQRARRTPAD
jgi:hypothetical protein